MKRDAYHHRCAHCNARRTLTRPWCEYSKGHVPACRQCGSRRWHRDTYRDFKELRNFLCKCSGAPYPHRKGTAAKGGRWGAWECEHHVPF